MSRTCTTSSSRPTLNAWSWTTSRGAPSTARNARAMSSTCTSGRHGVPSLCSRTSPLVNAVPVRLLTTMSRAQPRRGPVGRGVAQVGRAEAVVGELADALLGDHLALAVGGHRVEGGVLPDRLVAGRAVQRAGRGEQELGDAGQLRRLGQVDRAAGIDRVRGRRVEVADRVVRYRGEVHDGVEAREVRTVASRTSPIRPLAGGRAGAEVTAVVPAGVEARHLVPGGAVRRAPARRRYSRGRP